MWGSLLASQGTDGSKEDPMCLMDLGLSQLEVCSVVTQGDYHAHKLIFWWWEPEQSIHTTADLLYTSRASPLAEDVAQPGDIHVNSAFEERPLSLSLTLRTFCSCCSFLQRFAFLSSQVIYMEEKPNDFFFLWRAACQTVWFSNTHQWV